MKIILDYGNGTIWSLLIPPNAIFWAVLVLSVLLVIHWYFALQHRKIQSNEMKEIRDDNRQKEIAGVDSEGHAGHRPEKFSRKYEQHPLQ
jgi:hypothetical protein